jgi:hypothetical protein
MTACLVAGALVTVATAWACALWTPRPTTGSFQVVGMIERDGNPRPMPQTVAGAGFGFAIEQDGHIAWEQTTTGRGLGIEMDAERMASGWPFYALECTIAHNTMRPPAGRVRAAEQIGWNPSGGPWLIDGIPHFRWKSLHAQPWRFLPLRPRVAGFGADALIAGAGLWFAAFGWREVRLAMRAKRGRCLACGYPVAGLGRCPECGQSAWAALLRRVRSRIRLGFDGVPTAFMRRDTR